MHGSESTTRGVRVQVSPRFVAERSDRRNNLWVFSYEVRISNLGDRPVQLVARHWVITDANGRVEHVRGPGVVGEQPWIPPGAAHEYMSGCPLPTSLGSMYGSYTMLFEDGEQFEAEIAPFVLVEPDTMN